MTRPVKQELPKYLEIEEPLQEAIWRKYLGAELTEEEKVRVFEIDDAMLYYEFKALMDTRLAEEEPELKSEPEFGFRGFEEVEEGYLRVFGELSKRREMLS